MFEAKDYHDALDAFLRRIGPDRSAIAPARIYHGVRNLTYASDGNRLPLGVLQSGRGSCTGKHLLLRDLLRRTGQSADVVTVEGDFALGVPTHPSMVPELQAWTRHGGVRDFHNYVVWDAPEGEVRLDATWPDAMARYGFDVNAGWAGKGDTRLALEPVSNRGRAEDVISFKQQLLSELSAGQVADRLAFLALLTDWIALHSTGSDE